jgi:CHAT domain-containing protein
VPEEIEYVSRWLDGRRVAARRLEDAGRGGASGVGKRPVLEGLPRAALVHLACHGFFKAERPDQSGLVFVPRPDQIEVLTLRELSGLDLGGVRHVTLSSCWSADNFVLPGRQLISLPETLCRAGAESVLGCLWRVDDRVGTAFVKEFYRHLADAPREDALRTAQLRCLRGELMDVGGAATTHPTYWAGYQLYGNSDALRFARP